jgi:hypothetical protein
MKYIERLGTVDNKKLEKSYNNLGQISESREKIFAKFIESDVGNNKQQKTYSIATQNNIPYDPYGIDSHRESTLTLKLKNVSKQTFDYYILYLQTRNSLYMTRTQRSFING